MPRGDQASQLSVPGPRQLARLNEPECMLRNAGISAFAWGVLSGYCHMTGTSVTVETVKSSRDRPNAKLIGTAWAGQWAGR